MIEPISQEQKEVFAAAFGKYLFFQDSRPVIYRRQR